MLSNPSFPQAIQHIPTDDKTAETIGDCAPKLRYAMPKTVETLFPCPLEK